jgi:adenylate cyclase
MSNSDKDLLKRLAKLVKQNQELIESNERLKNMLEELQQKNDQNEQKIKKLSCGELKDEPIYIEKPSSLRFSMATVMFVNIHGFTNIHENMNSAQVMDELDEVLFHFDKILKKYKIQKIKTLGDSIMAAGGIPVKNISNPVDVVMAALEMQIFLVDLHKNSGREKKIWDLKIGIHTGPVMASISGKKKVSYDIKGDTVNMATRIESYSNNGNIVISVMTYELIKEFFLCEYHGKMPVKYKGDLELFSVNSIRPEFSEKGLG